MRKFSKIVPVAIFCLSLGVANLAMAKLTLGENETREDHADGSVTITSQNGNVTTKKNYSGDPTGSISGCSTNKIKCIKAAREVTGMGLKETKELVDGFVNNGSDTVDLSGYDPDKIKAAAEKAGVPYGVGNGRLQSSETYTDGQLTSRESYDGGKISGKENYEDGQLSSRENYEDGNLRSTDHFQDGVMMSTTYPKNDIADCSGTKIQCIKALKDASGMSLKEAKDYVDKNWDGTNIDLGGLSDGARNNFCANRNCSGSEDVHYNIQPNFSVPQAAQFIKDEGNEIGITF